MLLRQFPAASWRSSGASWNCTSFSVSAKVDVETGGPTSGAVPNAGGDPGGEEVSDAGLRQASVAANRAIEAPLRNFRREFGMPHCSGMSRLARIEEQDLDAAVRGAPGFGVVGIARAVGAVAFNGETSFRDPVFGGEKRK